jgi:hypothetical protein
LFSLIRAAQPGKAQVRAAQVSAHGLLRAVVEQALSSRLSGCDLLVYGVSRAEQALIRGTYFA